MNRQHERHGPSLRQACIRAVVAVVSLAAALSLGGPPPSVTRAAATTVTVNDAGDVLHSPGCATTGTGTCTLRDAITFANVNAGHDTIAFAIAGAGVHTITPATALPALTDASGATIDSYTQPGTAQNTAAQGTNAVLRIAVSGGSAPAANGITLASPGNVVRGLVIGGFAPGGTGLAVTAGAGNRVAGNFIGTNATGTAAAPNGDGVSIGAGVTGTVVGGAGAAERNLLSGNSPGDGVVVDGAGATGNTVANNLLGTAANGTSALGNAGWGVQLTGGASSNTVGPANVIAANGAGGVGVTAASSTGNTIRDNSIRANGGPGIDLGGAGTTNNDAGDLDGGANGLQNFPVITSALRSATGDRVILKVTQDSRVAAGPNAIDVYIADGAAGARGPGSTLITSFQAAAGATVTTTDPILLSAPLAGNAVLTAMATTTDGTSEFGTNVAVVTNARPLAAAGPAQALAVNTHVVLNGAGSTDPDAVPSGAGIMAGRFEWTQTAGLPVVLANPASATPSFEAVFGGVFTFFLVVSDGLDVSTNVATVTITVTDTTVPVVAPLQVTMGANEAKAIHPQAVDPDNVQFKWAIASPPEHGSILGFNEATGSAIYAPTPGFAGTDTFSVTASDGANTSLPGVVTITVIGRLRITTPARLPDAVAGAAYGAQLVGTGGTPPSTWSAPGGLPAGLALNAVTGAISGVAPAEGAYMFEITLTDSVGGSDTKTVTLKVVAANLRPNKLFVTLVSRDGP